MKDVDPIEISKCWLNKRKELLCGDGNLGLTTIYICLRATFGFSCSYTGKIHRFSKLVFL